MKKTLLITALTLSATAFAGEISIDGGAAYTFNLVNKYDSSLGKNKLQFIPKVPIKLFLKFNPSEINLKGAFNLENTEIDGLFKDTNILQGFSIDGNLSFLSNKLYKGLRVVANTSIIALEGVKYKDTGKKGDVDLELGLNYDFGKINIGGLAYYKSNALMTPQLLGMAFTIGYPQLNTDAKIRLSYNLGEYLGLSVYNPNKLDYSKLKNGDEIYYYSANSSINKLIPIVFEFAANNKIDVLENLTINSTLTSDFTYSTFNGKLSKIHLDAIQASNISTQVKNAIKDDNADKSELRDLMKTELSKLTGTEETVEYNRYKVNASAKIGLEYNIFDGLDMFANNKISLYYDYDKGQSVNNLLLKNTFDTNITYMYQFEELEALSLISDSGLMIKSEFQLKGTPNYSIKTVDGEYLPSNYSNVTAISISSDITMKYNIFETLSVKGGIGFELQGNLATNKTTGLVGKYNQTIPKIFLGATYEW